MVSISGGSSINILHPAGDVRATRPSLRGGGLVFHGFAPHSGRGYQSHNYRIHWYCYHVSCPIQDPGYNTHILMPDDPDYQERYQGRGHAGKQKSVSENSQIVSDSSSSSESFISFF